MSNRNRENLDDKQRLARDSVRSLSKPAANPDFRARLKAQFLAGEIAETDLSATELPGESEIRPLPASRTWLGWSALAAAAVLAALFLGFNRLPGPEVLATNGVGTVTVDGVEVAAGNTQKIEEALKAGARVQVSEGGTLDILYPGSFAMRLTAGSDLVLPTRPGRWVNRRVESQMAFGEVSVRTGPDLKGGSLVIRTQEGRTVINGTLVSVLRNEEVTCVCLLEGSAEIQSDAAELGDIPLGMRWVLFRDGSDPQLLEIVPAHRDHMLGLDRTLDGVFKP